MPTPTEICNQVFCQSWLLASENGEVEFRPWKNSRKTQSSLSLPSHWIRAGKEISPSQEAFPIPAKREFGPQVGAGPHEAAECLQNKQQDEETQSPETSQGCDSLGRGYGSWGQEADLPGKSTVPSAHRLGCRVPSKEGLTGWDNCPVFIFEKGYYTSRIIPSSLLLG